MKLNILSASQGYQWLRQANNIIQSNRVLFLGNTLLYIAAFIFVSFISLGSPVILASLIGILSVIFSTTVMLICHRSLNPDVPEASMTLTQLWVRAFKDKRILILAFITTLSLTFLFLVSNIIANFLFPELIQKNQEFLTNLENTDAQISTDLIVSAMPYYAMQQAFGIPAQIIAFLLFSMTPALIYWTNISYGQAMFYNLIACLKNWRTWLAWFFAVFTIFAILPSAALALLYVLTQAGLSALVLLATPIVFIFVIGLMLLSMVIVPASYYFAYKDCFIQNQQKPTEKQFQ